MWEGCSPEAAACPDYPEPTCAISNGPCMARRMKAATVLA